MTRNDVMDFWRQKRWGSAQQVSMLENEVRRDGLGKIKKDAKEDG